MARRLFQRLPNTFSRSPRRRTLIEAGFQPDPIDLSPDQVDIWARTLGNDYKLAQRVSRLAARFPAGTLPELVAYDWLQRQRLYFDYQVAINGGRTRAGGSVPDFVIYSGGDADAWLVQGEYWHGLAAGRTRDSTALARIPGQRVNGATIRRVVQLWEEDIYKRRPEVFTYALAGLDLRG